MGPTKQLQNIGGVAHSISILMPLSFLPVEEHPFLQADDVALVNWTSRHNGVTGQSEENIFSFSFFLLHVLV